MVHNIHTTLEYVCILYYELVASLVLLYYVYKLRKLKFNCGIISREQ